MNLIIALVTYNILLFSLVIFMPGKFLNLNTSLIKFENKTFIWKHIYSLLLFFIIIIAGTRESFVGTDYEGYLKFYNYILEFGYIGTQFKRVEIGWEYLNLTFAHLGIMPEIFFGLISGLISYFFIKASYKYQHLLPLMFFFYFTNGFFFWTLSGLRQSIAIMIFFFSIKFIIEKKLYLYIISIFFASLFHISALVLLPIYFLNYITFNQKKIFIIFTISIFFIGNDIFISNLESIMSIVGNKVSSFNQYLKYLESSKIVLDENRTGSGLGVLLRLIITYYIIYKSKTILEKIPSLNIYFIIFFIGAIGSNIFFSIELIGRILNYFNICFFIIIASTIYYSQKTYEKFISLVIILMYFILFNKQLFNIFSQGNL